MSDCMGWTPFSGLVVLALACLPVVWPGPPTAGRASASSASVEVSEIEPWYGSPWPDGYTDRTPVIQAALSSEQGFYGDCKEVWIDDVVCAVWNDMGEALWVRGNGSGFAEYVDDDSTRISLTYEHSQLAEDWLADGPHILDILFQEAPLGTWIGLDPEAPYAVFEVGSLGACCTEGAHCIYPMSPDDCSALGGEYMGDETECDPDPCPNTAARDVIWGDLKSLYRGPVETE